MVIDGEDEKDSSEKESERSRELYIEQRQACVKHFEKWSETQQVEFVEYLLSKMCHYQHGHINSYLKPMLQRDFITALPGKLKMAFWNLAVNTPMFFAVCHSTYSLMWEKKGFKKNVLPSPISKRVMLIIFLCRCFVVLFSPQLPTQMC